MSAAAAALAAVPAVPGPGEAPAAGHYQVSIWSSAHEPVLAALAEVHGCVQVRLCLERANPRDPDAVAVAVDLPERVAGGRAAVLDDGTSMRIVGYIARQEARRRALVAALDLAGAPIPAGLWRHDSRQWRVFVLGPEDQPF